MPPPQNQRVFASPRHAGAIAEGTAVEGGFEALWVSVAGNITVIMEGSGNTLEFSNVPVGWFPIGGTEITVATTATVENWGRW